MRFEHGVLRFAQNSGSNCRGGTWGRRTGNGGLKKSLNILAGEIAVLELINATVSLCGARATPLFHFINISPCQFFVFGKGNIVTPDFYVTA
jgi:hypothetical protein